jgi:hypothetical protein
MQTTFRVPALLILALTLTACGSFNTSTGDRSMNCRCIFSGSLHGSPDDATVTLGNKTVHVTAAQITWANKGSLPLPAAWKVLQLTESWDAIQVTLDGIAFATIHPNG